MAASEVDLEEGHVESGADDVEGEEAGGDGNVGDDIRLAAEHGEVRRIRGPLMADCVRFRTVKVYEAKVTYRWRLLHGGRHGDDNVIVVNNKEEWWCRQRGFEGMY